MNPSFSFTSLTLPSCLLLPSTKQVHSVLTWHSAHPGLSYDPLSSSSAAGPLITSRVVCSSFQPLPSSTQLPPPILVHLR
jgi:hypothetical protein